MRILPSRKAEWALLTVQLPGRPRQPIGVLLADSVDILHVRFRHDWSAVAQAEDAAILGELEADLIARGKKLGASAVLDSLESSASHAVQIGARQQVETTDAEHSLENLFYTYVDRVRNSRTIERRSNGQAHFSLSG